MSFKYFFESGDNATRIEWDKAGKDWDGSWYVSNSAETQEFNISFTEENTKGLSIIYVKFYKGSNEIEIQNDMKFHIGVGVAVKKAMKEYISRTNPEVVIFAGNKKEIKRNKLYTKYTKKLSKMMGYEDFYKTAIVSKNDEYVLVRKDRVKEFREIFPTSKGE